MRLFYYVHTGHRIGLDRFHRAAAILNCFPDADITLLCSDFRIASQARSYGIKRAVGVDVVRNIPQITTHGDKIIFDSDELNPVLHEDMVNYFSTFIRISDRPDETKHPRELLISPYLEGEGICKGLIVGEHYTKEYSKTIPTALFFGDDDYEKDLEAHQGMFEPYKMDLLMGFYHFLGYENALAGSFGTVHDSEEYDEVICATERLVTASPQALLQNLASGGKPVYLQRPDYPRDFIPLFESMGIEIVDGYDQEKLEKIISMPSQKRYEFKQNNQEIIEFIRKHLNL